jgi:type IV pilus assembly protein PilC
MPTYRYEAKDSAGKLLSGVLSASTLGEASSQLRSSGKFILALALESDKSAKKSGGFSLSFGPGAKDVHGFTSQLAVMIKAGISLRAAVEGIAEQVENPKFKTMLVQIKKDLESGKQFSDSLARYPKTFSTLYVNMVRASEMSGGLSRMLERIAGYLGQQIETMSMVRGAMIYPGIIGGLAVYDHLPGQGGLTAPADEAAAGAEQFHGQLLVRRGGGHGDAGVGHLPYAQNHLGPDHVR